MPAERSPLLRDNFRAPGQKYRVIAEALNRGARWCNTFDAMLPMVVNNGHNGVYVTWEPWETPFEHPFRVYPSTTDGKMNVHAGRVNTGSALATATGLSDIDAHDPLYVYLTVVHYYDRTAASTYTLGSSEVAWPASAHTSSSQTTVFRIAELDGLDLHQYIVGDVFCPLINPPLPGTAGNYALVAIAGVVQWVEVGACP